MTAGQVTAFVGSDEASTGVVSDPVKAWRDGLAIEGRNSVSALQRAKACIQRHAFAEALVYLTRAASPSAVQPEQLFEISLCYLELGEFGQGIAALGTAFRRGCNVSRSLDDFAPFLLRWFGAGAGEDKSGFPGAYGLAPLSKMPDIAATTWYMGAIAAHHRESELAACWLEVSRVLDPTAFANRRSTAPDAVSGVISSYDITSGNPYLSPALRQQPKHQRHERSSVGKDRVESTGYQDRRAQAAIDHVMKEHGRNPKVMVELAESLHAAGAIREAIWVYQRVLEIDVDNQRAQAMLRQLPDASNPALDDLLLVRFDHTVQQAASDAYYASRRADFYYNIDIVGSCNLRCPSCPVGNSLDDTIPRGFMDLATYERIVTKIKGEHPSDRKVCVDIHNWGESLLHPDLPKFIEATKKAGLGCGLSSNFNHNLTRKRLQDILNAKPDSLRVSLSGYSNESHQRTHRRGNINIVKSNLYLLRYMLDRLKSDVQVEVGYMVYKHNFGRDFVKVRQMCEELRFRFDWIFAVYMPVEKTIEANYGKYDENDRDLISQLVIEPKVWKAFADQSDKFRINTPGDCHLKKMRMAINFDGTVPICCASYSYDNHVAPNFLDVSHGEIQKRRDAHELCNSCAKSSSYFLYSGVHPLEAERRSYDNLNSRGAFVGKDGR